MLAVILLPCCVVPTHAALAEEPPALVQVSDWQSLGRIQVYDPAGFPCFDAPQEPHKELLRLYYKHPLILGQPEKTGGLDTKPAGFVPVRVATVTCFISASVVGPMHTLPVECMASTRPVRVQPLASLLDDPVAEDADRIEAGPLFPTFYQVAFEVLYPREPDDKPVSLTDEKGKTIAQVSPQFRKALLIQGTGALADGRVVNVAGSGRHGRRFKVLSKGSYGLGIAGYNIYPYRSAAVDFDWLCDKLAGAGGCVTGNVEKRDKDVTRANRKALVGVLLYLPRLDGVTMADGTTHDGRVCAVDVGGGIRNDRIDLFVGTDGAGNPYYPPCRRDNPWLAAGIKSLIPSDWRKFVPGDDGVLVREIETEYRKVAPGKGLEVRVFPNVRCRKVAK